MSSISLFYYYCYHYRYREIVVIIRFFGGWQTWKKNLGGKGFFFERLSWALLLFRLWCIGGLSVPVSCAHSQMACNWHWARQGGSQGVRWRCFSLSWAHHWPSSLSPFKVVLLSPSKQNGRAKYWLRGNQPGHFNWLWHSRFFASKSDHSCQAYTYSPSAKGFKLRHRHFHSCHSSS